jgi:hypothetical protein
VLHARINDSLLIRPFTIIKDPRSPATTEDYDAYLLFAKEVREQLTKAHNVIIEIRDIRAQLLSYKERIQDDTLKKEIARIDSLLTRVEENLYQTKNKSGQDPLNFPERLTNKLAYLNSILGSGEFRPTQQAYAVREEISSLIDAELAAFDMIRKTEIPAFNKAVRDKQIDAIILKP